MALEIAGYLADKLVAEVLATTREQVFDDITRQLEEVDHHLATLEGKLDQQLLAPLRAGLTFMRLGHQDDALREFVRAVAVEPYSAVAKYWLGHSLITGGNVSEAKNFLGGALGLNPFLLDKPYVGFFEPNPLEKYVSNWERQFPDKALRRAFPNKVQRFKREFFSERHASAALKFCSLVNGFLVVSWLSGHGWEYESEGVVTAFDLRSGDPNWHYLTSSEARVLCTPLCVVIIEPPPNQKTIILGSDDGKVVRTLSPSYFSAVFGRIPNPLMEKKWIGDLTTHFFTPKKVIEKTSVIPKKRWGPDHEVQEENIRDQRSLLLKRGDTKLSVELANTWTHQHILKPPPPRAPICDLWSKASIKCLVAI